MNTTMTRPPAAPAAEPEPMSAVDHAWLEMDEPHNPMVVASIMEFEGVDNPEALADRFVERTLRERRFRQRVIETGDGCAWVEDDDIHRGYHVQVRHLERKATPAMLYAAIGAELGHGLDRALPLWRICVFALGAGRVTVLFRAHHAIADGVAMMHMLLYLADGAPTPPEHAPAVLPPRAHGPLGGVIRTLESVNHLVENLTEMVVDDLREPGRFSRELGDVRRTAGAVARVLMLPDDNPDRFRKPPTGRRAVAWTSNLSFPAVRKFAHAQGVTINDVFLTALSGAFGRYLRAVEGSVAEDQNLRISVPVNLRADGGDGVGNGFGLVLADLPIGLEGWHARLDVISDRMAALKQSAEAKAVLIALAAAGCLPTAAERKLVNLVSNKSAAVVSNLPGPRQALKLGGATLANMVFWPPQAAGIGIGVSCLSYAGHITVGVSADAAVIEKPQQLIDALVAELEDMLGHSAVLRLAAPRRRPSPHSTARSPTGAHHAKAH